MLFFQIEYGSKNACVLRFLGTSSLQNNALPLSSFLFRNTHHPQDFHFPLSSFLSPLSSLLFALSSFIYPLSSRSVLVFPLSSESFLFPLSSSLFLLSFFLFPLSSFLVPRSSSLSFLFPLSSFLLIRSPLKRSLLLSNSRSLSSR